MAGQVKVNGTVCRRPDTKVQSGDRIDAVVITKKEGSVLHEPRIVYRDDFLIAIDKPAGLPTHRTSDPQRPNLYDWLCQLLARESEPAQLPGMHRPGLLHRLDAETSGLLLFSLQRQMNAPLMQQFESNAIEKSYLALVTSNQRLPASWSCDASIIRAERKRNRYRTAGPEEEAMPAFTAFKCIWQKDGMALIEALPKTGRPHQIRVHLAHMNMPVVGDSFYRGKPAKRLMLHARRLTFVHPASGKRLTLTAEADFDKR